MQEPENIQSQQPAQPSMYTPSSSAPIPEPSGYIPPAMQSNGLNDSGTGPTAVLPEQLKGFNWGAALMTWIWSIGHQFWLGLLSLPLGFILGMIPIIGILLSFGIMIGFGVKGNEWAWQNRKWDSIEQFQATQRVWMMWGIGLMIFFIIAAFGFGLMAAMIAGNVARTNPGAFQP